MSRRAALALALTLAACAGPSTTSDRAAGEARTSAATRSDPIGGALDLAQDRLALGDRDSAERALRDAIDLMESQRGPNDPTLAPPLLQLALIATDQRRIGEADAIFQRVERLVATGDPADRARLTGYRAIRSAALGQLEEAAQQARAATLARRDILRADGRQRLTGPALATGLAELAHGLAVEATLNLRLGRLDQAEFAANLARRILVDLRDVPEWWIAEVDEIVGLIEAERRQFEPARDRIGTAVATRMVVFGERRPVALGFLALGRINQRAGDSTLAVTDTRRGLELLRRSDAGDLGFGRLNDLLSTLASAAQALPAESEARADESFQASQLGSRGATSRTVSLTVARLAGQGNDAEDVRRLQQAIFARDEARLALGREAARVTDDRDVGMLERLRAEVRGTTAAVDQASQRLGTENPRLAALMDQAPVSRAELAPLLESDEALVAFTIGPEAAWVFAVGRDAIASGKLAISGAEIARRVKAMRETLEPGPQGVLPFDIAAAHDLHDLLLGPVAAVVGPARRLVMVLDGALQSLPPALLVSRPAAPGDYARAGWLGVDKVLTLAPSVRTFHDLRRLARPSTAPRPLLAMGDPALTGRAAGLGALGRFCQTTQPVPADLIRGLTPLPETASEVRQVAAALGAGRDDVILGTAATEQRLRQASLDQYRVLYFATHGLLPGELRCESEPGLVMTPVDGATARDSDGLLTASEIARLKLDADLVVLSACNTGAAGDLGGEALSGLARAFFHAGTRALLVSHWQVESRATAALMTQAFARQADGAAIGIGERLRRAQQSLLADPRTAHPLYWAAFTLVGDGRTRLNLQ